jgi:uncharacterized protein YbgA (DUF1722 family)
MMVILEIQNFSMQNGLASSATPVMVFLQISPNAFYAHLIASLAIWQEMTLVLSLKENLHHRTAVIISAKQQENVLLAVEGHRKHHKSSTESSIASLQTRRKLTLMFVLIQQYTRCLMARIISSSY